MILGVEDWVFWLLFGVVLAGTALVIFIVNLWICYCNKWYKTGDKGAMIKEEGMVDLQTSRTVGGESMSQVIFKSQPNGTMDRVNQNDMPYRTMDPETNTVRYETALHEGMTSYHNQDSGVAGSPASSGHHESTNLEAEGSSASAEAAADVHISFNNPEPAEGYTNKAAEISESDSEADAIPRRAYYSTPPAPTTGPPPLTPGTPPPDSPSSSELFPPPPPVAPAPPPAPEEPRNIESLYASIDRRNRQGEPSSRADTMMASVWRPRDSSEIEIIEK